MNGRLRRHPFRQTADGPEKFCPGCDRFRPVSEFSKRRKGARAGEFLSRCKECLVRPKVQHDEVTGWVPITRVWWIFDEITQRVGQQRGAAAIGVTADTMRAVLYRRQRSVQRRRVYHALLYLRQLRTEGTWEAPTLGRPLKYASPYEIILRCNECNGELENFTSGCYTCMDRKSHRRQRERKGNWMFLSRAQCLGLWSLASTLPNNMEVQILDRDNHGAIQIEVKADSPYLPHPKRYKLPLQGGHREIKQAVPAEKTETADPE